MIEPSENMAKIRATAKKFLVAGEAIYKKNSQRREREKEVESGSVAERRFCSAFGVDILVCAIAWEWLEWKGTIPEGGNKEHFLWACLQLMVYPTENVLSMLLQVNEKTFRKWAWSFLLALSDLECDMVSGRFA